jgi:hypothetical protein
MTEDLPHITCPVCNMTSHNPHDVRWGYCGKCQTTTNGLVCKTKCTHMKLGEWSHNPIVTDKPIIRNGPTRPPVPGMFDWLMRGLFTLVALAAVVYLVCIVVIT